MYFYKEFKHITLKDKEIINYLRRGKGSKISKRKSLDKKYINRISEMKEQSKNMFDAKGIYKILNVTELPTRDCFSEAEKVALAIVTIGPKLPLATNKLMDEGNYVDGVILDAIGSAGAEEIANLIDNEIKLKANNQGFEYSRRFSPGYCNWDVKDQELMFFFLPNDKIEVTLSESYMMNPIKSVSFAINLGKNVKESRWENRCKYCEIGDCSYRFG